MNEDIGQTGKDDSRPEQSAGQRILKAIILGLALLAIIYGGCLIAANYLGFAGPRDIFADPSVIV